MLIDLFYTVLLYTILYHTMLYCKIHKRHWTELKEAGQLFLLNNNVGTGTNSDQRCEIGMSGYKPRLGRTKSLFRFYFHFVSIVLTWWPLNNSLLCVSNMEAFGRAKKFPNETIELDFKQLTIPAHDPYNNNTNKFGLIDSKDYLLIKPRTVSNSWKHLSVCNWESEDFTIYAFLISRRTILGHFT